MGAMVITMSVSGLLKKLISLEPLYIVAGISFIVGIAVLATIFKLPNRLPTASPGTVSDETA